MLKTSSKFIAAAVLVTCTAFATSAYAASTWTFSSGPSVTQSGTDPSLTSYSGVYAANGGSFTNSTTYSIDGFASGAKWIAAPSLEAWTGGLGLNSDGGKAPNHAFDNGPKTSDSSTTALGLGNTEALLLQFSDSVILTGINLGYRSGDSDISLFRYTYTDAPTLPGTGAALSSMLSAGWELVQNKADLATDTTSPYSYNAVNAGELGSSWWLISAFNTSYGSGTSLNQGNDYFKISHLAAKACVGTDAKCGELTRVPEPASLALVGLGLIGMVIVRRRKTIEK